MPCAQRPLPRLSAFTAGEPEAPSSEGRSTCLRAARLGCPAACAPRSARIGLGPAPCAPGAGPSPAPPLRGPWGRQRWTVSSRPLPANLGAAGVHFCAHGADRASGRGASHEPRGRTGCSLREERAASRAASALSDARGSWSPSLCPWLAPGGSSDAHSRDSHPQTPTPMAPRMENGTVASRPFPTDFVHGSWRKAPAVSLAHGSIERPPSVARRWRAPRPAAAARGASTRRGARAPAARPRPPRRRVLGARAAPTLARRSGRGRRGASARRTWTTRPPCATPRRRS